MKIALAAVSAIYYMRVFGLARERRKTVWIAIGLCAFQAVYAIWPQLYYLDSNAYPALSISMIAVEGLFMIGLLHGLTGQGWMKIILFYCLGILASTLSALIIFGIFGVFSGISVPVLISSQWNNFLISVLIIILQMALLIGIAELVCRHLNRDCPELRWTQLAPIFAAQAVSILVLYILFIDRSGAGRTIALTAIAILVLLYFIADGIIFQAFRAFVKNSELTKELDYMTKQQEMQRSYYLSLDEQLRIVRRLRHDYKNTLQTVDRLIAEGDTQKAAQLAAECKDLFPNNGPNFYTGNNVLDAVLNNKALEAKKLGIEFDVILTLPTEYSISEIDLMSIFSNLLDNALAYTSGVSGELKKSVSVDSSVRAGLWVICFSNSFYGNCLPSFQTSKPDKELHGQGMGIVRAIVDKYDGTFQTKIAEGWLKITITLNAVAYMLDKESRD